jgi:hypothetical protein
MREYVSNLLLVAISSGTLMMLVLIIPSGATASEPNKPVLFVEIIITAACIVFGAVVMALRIREPYENRPGIKRRKRK